jgi:sulfur carrier protein ThiS
MVDIMPCPSIQPAAALPVHAETFLVVAAADPFTDARVRGRVPVGTSLADVLEQVQPDPRLRRWAIVVVNETQIPAGRWESCFPEAGDRVAIVVLPPQGGEGMPWAAVALMVVVGVVLIATGYGAPAGAGLLATVGPMVAGVATIASAGFMAYTIATAPQIPTLASDPVPKSGTLAATSIQNRANLWGAIPRILGRHRAVPPYAALPYTEVVGGDQWLRVIFALSYGPVLIEDMKIGETGLAEFSGIETEFRRGYLPAQIVDRGAWDAAQGQFPAGPAFGDTFTIATGGTIDGVVYVAGETITFNGLAPPSSAAAWDKDQQKPFTIYPGDVYQEGLSLELTKDAGWLTRTSATEADELSVDVTFPAGLFQVAQSTTSAGAKRDFTVEIEIRYAPAGTANWISLGVFPITGRQQDPLFWGTRWRVDPRNEVSGGADGRFDVSVRRLTADNPTINNEVFAKSFWTSLRTLTREDPVDVPGLAMLAMRIKPTELAHGTIDAFSCTLTSIASAWHAGAWSWRPTSDPAALYRAVLQVAPTKTLTDDQIDVTRLEEWSDFCAAKGFVFNAYVDWEMSRRDALGLIGAAGRAYPIIRNGLKRSVAIDNEKAEIVQVFTPANSWGYREQIVYPRTPHGYRIAFANEHAGYAPDERIVYADGYDATNATDIEGVDFLGVTDADQIWKNGRFYWAQRDRRFTVHSWLADVEALVCERFDRVRFAHDTIGVGLGFGRIRAVTLDGETITALVLDTRVTMEAGRSYTVQVRNADRGVLMLPVVTAAGETGTVTLANPVAAADGPETGDLVIFGETGRETLDLLVQSVEPQQDLTVRIVAIPYAPEIHNADAGTLPVWQSHVSAETLPAPVVPDIRSDANVMLAGPSGALQSRVVFSLQAVQSLPHIGVTVLQRPSGGGTWKLATIQSRSPTLVAITGVEDGETYDFRIQYTHPDRAPSRPATISAYRVIGREGLPAALAEFSIAAAGNAALLRWARIGELDVRFGGTIAFRHSPLMSGATWGTSVSIGTAVKGSDDHAWLPLKPGTYLARVFDASGRAAAEVNTITTRQASVLAFVDVGTLVEDPVFAGTHLDTEAVDGRLQLKASAGLDDEPDWDAIPDFDRAGRVPAAGGVYGFAAGLDFGAVSRVRLTSHILMTISNPLDLIDDRSRPIDDWPDIDGVDGAPGDASVWIKITDNDPAGTPVWSEFIRLDSGRMPGGRPGRMPAVADRHRLPDPRDRAAAQGRAARLIAAPCEGTSPAIVPAFVFAECCPCPSATTISCWPSSTTTTC